jgi:hypothetical protein
MMRVVLVLALPGTWRAGAFLRHAAVRRIRLVVYVARLAGLAVLVGCVAMLVVIMLTGVSVIGAFAVMTFAGFPVLLVIRQFANFVSFAGPEERERS